VTFFQEYISIMIMEFLINEIPPQGEKVLRRQVLQIKEINVYFHEKDLKGKMQ
jgi:hypothetical protein